MNPLLYKYPLDKTGLSSKNRVVSEYHDLSSYTNEIYRPFVLDHGYFFVESLNIFDNTGFELVRNVDYQVTGLNAAASQLTGQEVCSVIVAVNPRVTTQLYVDANMVGGEYTDVSPSIVQMCSTLLNDTRSVHFNRITNKPDAYTPGGHMHALWHLYGFEVYRDRVQEITEAVLTKSRTEIDALYTALSNRYSALRNDKTDIQDALTAHINDHNNPHQVTKAQVGLGQVPNYPIASIAEASVSGEGRNDRLTTPHRTQLVIDANFGTSFNHHVANINNPHQVNFSQVGAYSTQQINQMMSELLGITTTALSSYRLEGMTYQEIFDHVRNNLNTNVVVSGRFPPNQLGSGTANNTTVLVGNGQWVPFASLYDAVMTDPTTVLYVGYQGQPSGARNYIINTYSGVDEGTIILYRDEFRETQTWTNGVTVTTVFPAMKAMMRTAAGWVGPFNERIDIIGY